MSHLRRFGLDGLGEAEEGKREVNEAVLVVFDLVLASNDFVKLETDETCCKRGGSCDSRDNLAGNEFRLVLVCDGDSVTECPQV